MKISQFSQKTSASQTHFGFTNIGSGMPTLRDRAKWKSKFWFGSPCRFYLHKQFVLLQIVLCIQIISFLCKTVYAWTGQYIDIHISWSVTIWEFYLHRDFWSWNHFAEPISLLMFFFLSKSMPDKEFSFLDKSEMWVYLQCTNT